jgi:hypothetical protein
MIRTLLQGQFNVVILLRSIKWAPALVERLKRFVMGTLYPVANVIKLFTAVSYDFS